MNDQPQTNDVPNGDYLRGLTEEQCKAATHLYGGLLVLAPVGTGKTEVMARRAAHAIAKGISADKMLCLSFTNRAAGEMKSRIQKLLGEFGMADHARALTVCTFHSLCTRILRREADAAGISPDFSIYDEEDSIGIVTTLRAQFSLKVDPKATRKLDRALHNFIAQAKIEPYQTKSPEPLEKIFYRYLNTSAIKEGGIDLRQNFFLSEFLNGYNAVLRDSNALDFTDLQTTLIDLFRANHDALARWQAAYDWIQVDEVQDTSVAEYWILSLLASTHKNLAFFGDTHQTIFEWRDSKPAAILPRFEADFAPVSKVGFRDHHRSTPNLLEAALSLFDANVAQLLNDISDYEIKRRGEKVKVHEAQSPADEAFWIASEIRNLHEQEHLPYHDVAIITRRHDLNEKIAGHLRFCGVPIYLVEDSKFFQRAEIKDALAYLRLLVNPLDIQAFRRAVLAVPSELSSSLLDEISMTTRESGLRLYDFLNPLAEKGDIFNPLLEAYERDALIAIDTESTGLNVYQDDVIEVAAVKFGRSGKVAEFHRYIKPTKPVGDSERVHGLSDAYLQEHGREAKIVFGAFLDFIDRSVLVGHNIRFDVELLKANLRRHELDLVDFIAFDTLDLSRRYAKLRDYKLLTLCRHFGISLPTHRAFDDALAVTELVKTLLPKLTEGASLRAQHLFEYGAYFKPFAARFEQWRKKLDDARPQVILERVLEESGLREYWHKQKDGNERLVHLSDLSQRFSLSELDRKVNPRESLQFLLEQSSLGFGGLKIDEEKVPIITAHQAKGLEFAAVFVAGATDNEFPHWLIKDEKGVEQERKLLYVAITRAKKHLYISFFTRDEKDFKQKPSRFIQQIPSKLLAWS
ncbi:MAG: 3'-5' exonuclease [Chloroherpetonaceae bacterium]